MDSKIPPAEKKVAIIPKAATASTANVLKSEGQIQKTTATSCVINFNTGLSTANKIAVNPIIGSVIDIKSQFNYSAHTSVPFAEKFRTTPSIITSLVGFRDNKLEATTLWNKHWVTATNIKPEGFTIESHTFSRSSDRWSQAQWMALSYPEHNSIQTGEWSVPVVRPVLPFKTKTLEDVRFPRSFESIPRVTAWFSGFESHATTVGISARLSVDITDITCSGFSMDINKYPQHSKNGPSATVYGMKISWIAYDPATLPGIWSGTASTDACRPRNKPQHFNMGYIRFKEGTFKAAPRVMIGLNEFEFGTRVRNQLKVRVSEVSAEGMCWHADSADNTDSTTDTKNDGTLLKGAGISYIAME